MHPNSNVTDWRPPYGNNNQEPETNCLKIKFDEIENMMVQYELLINRVMIHTCKKPYCKTVDCQPCRFGFPKELHGYRFRTPLENSNILIAERDPTVAEEGSTVCGESVLFLRNHPQEVTHIPEMLIIWNGNTETRPTVSYAQVLNYLLGYMMKMEKSSKAYKEILRCLVQTTDEDATPRKLFCQILNKTIGLG